MLAKDVEDLIQKIRFEIRRENGYRVSRSDILRAAIRFLGTLELDLSNVSDESDLLQRIIEAAKK